MSNIWSVSPETDRIEGLEYRGHDFWIEVKRDLTKGESERVRTAGFRGVTGFAASDRPQPRGEERETEILIDWGRQSMARTLEYLVDWSLADDKGNKLPLTPAARKRETIEALRSEVYEIIENAITAHVERREVEKKLPPGDIGPKAISA